MRERVKVMPSLCGQVTVPGDKSVSHRALLIGALAEGTSVIENFLDGADCLSTIQCLRALGIEISFLDKNTVVVVGRGLNGLLEPDDVLQAGNSGTTMRLLLGILAGQSFPAVLSGDASLRSRPMGRVIKPLSEMGACFVARHNNEYAPVTVCGGSLQAITYQTPLASAQVKSAVLLAGLFAAGQTVVQENMATRDHTERLLRYFGADVQNSDSVIRLQGRPRLQARRVVVPGDISSAAYLLTAAVLLPGSNLRLNRVGINPTRRGFLEVLQAMGADLVVCNQRVLGEEPVADLLVTSAAAAEASAASEPRLPLKAITISGPLIPNLLDEIPLLALLAVFAAGVTEIRDAAELHYKESDRLHAVAEGLRALGAQIEELPDGLRITGSGWLHGGCFAAHNDHRLALLGEIAALLTEEEVVIDNRACEVVSFPGFQEMLSSLLVD